MSKRIALFVLGVAIAPQGMPYKEPTHATLSAGAVEQSVVAMDSDLLPSLGLKPYTNDETFVDSQGAKRFIRNVVGFGATLEDSGFRSVNHFFDPQQDGKGLWYAGGEPSPAWILDGQDQDEEFSWRKARAHFVAALTAPDSSKPSEHWGLLFQNLGHVIHHIQDMAQPEHTRHDPHVNKFEIEEAPWRVAAILVHDPSYYERYSDGAGRPKWTGLASQTVLPAAFPSAKDFWSNSKHTGMADFTSRNFLSKDTNFLLLPDGSTVLDGDHSLPAPGNPLKVVAVRLDSSNLGLSNGAQLCEKLKHARESAEYRVPADAECVIEFVPTRIENHGSDEPAVNVYTSSLSLFDPELTGFGKTYIRRVRDEQYTELSRLFTLNRFNFDAGYPYLIRRAVAYSTGLINHFFRARMQMESTDVQGDQVRIEIANASADGNAFGPGTFQLYYSSYSGVRKPLPLFSDSQLGRAELSPGGSREFRFNVPFDVDLNAESPYVLVYTGVVGEEEAVGGLVFDVPDVYQGFTFGQSGARLMYKRAGQWHLHPQSIASVGGSADWQGQYVGGKPTRMLTWQASPYNEIYRSGKVFAVAPYPVYAAALQKDAAGKDWIVAICGSQGTDIVITRPAKRSKSAALHDPVAAPEGWRVIGTNQVIPGGGLWRFNGDGTEAQTLRNLPMREDQRGFDETLDGRGLPLPLYTRLKVLVDGDRATFIDMGNPTMSVETAHDLDWATKTVTERLATTGSGRHVVAVDYLDRQELLAHLSLQLERTDAHDASEGDSELHVLSAESERTTVKLEFGSVQHNLVDVASDYRGELSVRSGLRQVDETSKSVAALDAVLAMDLRSNLLAVVRNVRTHQRPIEGANGGESSIHDEYLLPGPGTFPARSTEPLGRDSWPESSSSCENFLWVSGVCQLLYPTDQIHDRREWETHLHLGQWFVERAAWEVGRRTTRSVSSATALTGDYWFSLWYRDEATKDERYYNFFTGGDLAAITGKDPDRTFFADIRPY